jgi:hypothetical protein
MNCDFPADEIVLLAALGKDPARLNERLSLPLRRVTIEQGAG